MTTVLASRDASWAERSATLAVFLALGIAVGTWAAALPGLQAKLGLSDGQLSIALLAVALASVLATLVTGAVAPRFGTGRSTGVAAAGTMLAFASPALADSFAGLLLAAAALGLTVGALDIAVNAHAGDIERRWRQPIMSSFHAAFSVGGLLGSGIGGFLAWAGWGVESRIVLPVLGAAVLVLLAMPKLGGGARHGGQGIALALPERAALPLCAIALLCFLLEGAMADWSAVYLATVTGAASWLAAAGYAAFSIAMAAGRLVGDAVVRRLGPRRTVRDGALVAAAGLGLAVAWPEPVAAALGFALVGLGAANIVPVVFSGAGAYGRSPAAGIAMVATAGYAGFLGGPPLIGAVAAAAGLRIGMAVVVAAPLLALLSSMRMGRPDEA